MIKKLKLTSKILSNIFVLLFGVVFTGGIIADENATQINQALNEKVHETVKVDTEGQDLEWYKSDFASIAEVKEYTELLSEEVVGSGSVLLKNDDALPLDKNSKVNLYSVSSVDLVYAGTGSSGTNTSASVKLDEALTDAGLEINRELWNWYSSHVNTYGRGASGGTVGQTFAVRDANWSQIGTDAKNSSADAAIFVLARNGGEGADLTVRGGSSSDMSNGNYLELSPNEKSVLANLKTLKDNGTIGKIIVLMNSANQVQCDFMDDDTYGIDALLWIGDVGTTGIRAVADILVGEVNPSGRLSDTFWKKHYYNPVLANFGAYSYTGSLSSHGNTNSYVVYQEGVYMGYRYTETRYEDVVLGTANAGEFNYEEVVSYPFGYGLSYTQFDYSKFSVKEVRDAEGKKYEVSVTVTNSGEVAGKEAVQIYLQRPYTDYDIENYIEKPAVELVAFDKTKMLEAGESQTLTITVDEKYFAAYDAWGEGTYVLEKGDYYLTVGYDAHSAINNILATKGYDTSNGMTDFGSESLVQKIEIAQFDAETYSYAVTGEKIVNQFDNTDLNRYSGKGDNHVDYISRNNWEGTVKLGLSETHSNLNNQVKITVTDQMKQDVAAPVPQPDDIEYPTYGADNGLSLATLRAYEDGTPVEFDNEMWDLLLDQLTWQQTVELCSNGFRMTYGVDGVINKPQTIDHNGATGPVQAYNDNSQVNNDRFSLKYDDPDKAQKPCLYPCNGLLASTFDKELIKELGKAMGEDCLWAGYSGIYGPGLNTHRSVYGGRTFEYYSEDPILTGFIAAAETQGYAEKGVYVYLKHCVLNDQEKNREGLCTWANEQSIREIYLRAFQIAIEDGGADCVMTAFNRLGVVWSGHQGFCKTVLRGEFGMTGFAVSDWYQSSYMTLAGGILNGNDLPDADRISSNELNAYKEGYGELAWAMRDAAHRILYTVAQSNAMNDISAGDIMVKLTPTWKKVLSAVEVATGIACAVSVTACIALYLIDYLKNKNK
ncbi:MAG: beta-glucosidase [Clostridiales bacterium]|nr:beta-glucosidase [Clostridiales bacterium]